MKKLLFCLSLLAVGLWAEPQVLYLTWKGDPTTSMVIHWHSSAREPESLVGYQEEGMSDWRAGRGSALRLGGSGTLVHTVELTGLRPDTRYRFRVGEEGEEHLFRTCPQALDRPLKFAVGGDAYFYLYLLRKMNRQIASSDPDFVLVGGDIAYTQNHKSLFKGKNWEEKRWTTFFREWKKEMVAPDGRLIPLVVLVGNHDVKARTRGNLFYMLFAAPEEERPYRKIEVGDYLNLFCLDTGHTVPVEGEQTEWLEGALEGSGADWKMAVYHVAAYPSVYKYESLVPTKIRSSWVPLFEKHGVRLAFEHHNHAYKRTHPLKGGKIDPEGVVYLGDGSWGVSPRKPEDRWYLAKTAQTNCFWLVTLSSEECKLRSMGRGGKTIEELSYPR